jgi:hypothetical protein
LKENAAGGPLLMPNATTIQQMPDLANDDVGSKFDWFNGKVRVAGGRLHLRVCRCNILTRPRTNPMIHLRLRLSLLKALNAGETPGFLWLSES